MIEREGEKESERKRKRERGINYRFNSCSQCAFYIVEYVISVSAYYLERVRHLSRLAFNTRGRLPICATSL